MFNETIVKIEEVIDKMQNLKNEKINEQIADVFKKIKSDEEYKKSFFIKNWKIILFGIYLKKGIDSQHYTSNNGYEYEEFLSSIENFEELKESKKIIKYFPDSVAFLDTTIIVDNDKKYFIEVFKSADVVDESYCGSTDYYFVNKFIDTIVDFYSTQQTVVVEKFRALVEYYFSDCKKCKFFSTCSKQEYEKEAICLKF